MLFKAFLILAQFITTSLQVNNIYTRAVRKVIPMSAYRACSGSTHDYSFSVILIVAVSYTHLDVYKRQPLHHPVLTSVSFLTLTMPYKH